MDTLVFCVIRKPLKAFDDVIRRLVLHGNCFDKSSNIVSNVKCSQLIIKQCRYLYLPACSGTENVKSLQRFCVVHKTNVSTILGSVCKQIASDTDVISTRKF